MRLPRAALVLNSGGAWLMEWTHLGYGHLKELVLMVMSLDKLLASTVLRLGC